MTDLGPVSGTVDLSGADARRTEALAEGLRATFRRYGYGPVETPVLEHAAPFLDRSGEDTRRKMYIFNDPSGRELCLRPELTIPTARHYTDRLLAEGGAFRAYAIGPVFRYQSPREGRYRQFTQAGVELFGEADVEAADAEVLALAHDALTSSGLTDLVTTVADVAFFTAALDHPRVGADWRARLTRLAADPRRLAPALDRATAAPAADDDTEASDGERLDQLLAELPAALRGHLLQQVIGALDTEALGIRTPNEIAERLITRSTSQASEPIHPEVADLLRALLAVDLPLPEGIEVVATLAADAGSTALLAVVAQWRRRLELFTAHGLDVGAIRLTLGLRQGLDYYSSFIFEIHDATESAVSQLCTGGRYDRLIDSLSHGEPVPAVGFALGLERLSAGLAGSGPAVASVDAVVTADAGVTDAQLVVALTTLRRAGLSAGTAPDPAARFAVLVRATDAVVTDRTSGAEQVAAPADLPAVLLAARSAS